MLNDLLSFLKYFLVDLLIPIGLTQIEMSLASKFLSILCLLRNGDLRQTMKLWR